MVRIAEKTARTRKVISYLRFSRPEQMLGDSTRRQLEASIKWAADRGLTIDESLSDKGISAFRGKHAAVGALSEFLRLVNEKQVPTGSILLVESLDRLSRQELIQALQQFLAVINAGITIVTLCDGFEYSAKDCNLQSLMYSLMVMSRAHEESAIKSQRCAAAWGNKKKHAATKPLTAKLPGWLKMQAGRIVVDEPFAAVVRRMFALAIEGYGSGTMVKKLNGEKVAGRLVKHFPKGYIQHTLNNRAVLGEYQPCKYVESEKTYRVREPVGDPVIGYYPPIIDEQTYYAAQHARKSRLRDRGPNTHIVNVLKGLVFDAHDGSALQISCKGGPRKRLPNGKRVRTKGAEAITDGRCYVSFAAANGIKGASQFVGFPRIGLEIGIAGALVLVGRIKPTDGTADKLTTQIEAMQGEIMECDQKIAEVQEAMFSSKTSGASVVAMLSRLDQRKAELEQKLSELKGEKATGSLPSAMVEIKDATKTIEDQSDLTSDKRVRLHAAMKRLVERVDCDLSRIGHTYTCKAAIKLHTGEILDTAFQIRRLHRTADKPFHFQWLTKVD
jgi:DNA invertase Pin-like site-specific DNA recombinase